MSDRSRTQQQQHMRPGHTRYTVVTFMVTLAMITYLDRACIGAMAPSIAKEFALDEAQMGWVFFAFASAYALFEIPTARWADRRGARAVIARIVTWWSVFTLATAGAFNYASLLVTRFLFGAGEAGAWPCVARVFSRWIPQRERGTVKGIFFAGAYTSGALTTLAVTALLPYLHWRTILLAFGGIGFVWVIAWHRWFRDDPAEHPGVSEAERQLILADRPPDAPHPSGWEFWRALLRQRNVLLLCLMYMPNCTTFYFCITWLPTYLMKQHGFEKTALGVVASLPLFMSIATQFLGGFWSDRITARSGLRAGRRTPGVVGYAAAGVFILAASLTGNPLAAAVLIGFAAAACMLTTAPA
ncbi:MAG TPA: MFS transporter, partial [Povalibacter sp.]